MFLDYDKTKIRFYSIVLDYKTFALVGTNTKIVPEQSRTVKDSPKDLDNPWFTAKMEWLTNW